MNERIQKLAEQAGISYLSSVHPDMWEKFAELIVKECISKLDGIGVIDRDSRTIAMKVISEHFGIEESEQSAADRILSTIRKRS